MHKHEFKKLGLVLAGGGGRGAYQIGIFKALKESGLYDKVQIMSGVSVGALNEVLFLHENYELANYIWRCTIESAILYLDKERLSREWGSVKQTLRSDSSHKFDFSILKGVFSTRGFKAGIFSREGLINILRHEIDLGLILKSSKALYATATQAETKRIDYFNLNSIKNIDTIIQILLASSALPAIFAREVINGQEYYDGGIHNNTPMEAPYQEGCDLILVLHLFRTRDKINHALYPNAKIIELIPEQSLGGLLGPLDFSTKSMRSFIKRGYEEHQDAIHSIANVLKIKSAPKLFLSRWFS